jgi:hypothetical protein
MPFASLKVKNLVFHIEAHMPSENEILRRSHGALKLRETFSG